MYETHEPFDEDEKNLKCLSSGLVDVDGKINCDDAEDIGKKIHEKMDGNVFYDISLKRTDQVITLQELSKKVCS